MRYFVRGPDGRQYGPAEVETLREWARAERLPPDATLIAEDTRQEARADAVLGDPQTWPPPIAGMPPCPNCGRPRPPGAGPPGAAPCPYCGARASRAPFLGLPRGCLIALIVVAVVVFGAFLACNAYFTLSSLFHH